MIQPTVYHLKGFAKNRFLFTRDENFVKSGISNYICNTLHIFVCAIGCLAACFFASLFDAIFYHVFYVFLYFRETNLIT